MFLFLAKLLYWVRLWEEVVTISHGKIVQLICNFAWLKTKVCCWIDCKYIVFIKLQRCCLVFIKECVLLYVAPFLWEHVIERPCLLKLQGINASYWRFSFIKYAGIISKITMIHNLFGCFWTESDLNESYNI